MGWRDEAEYWQKMWHEQYDTNTARIEEMRTQHLHYIEEMGMRHREDIAHLKAYFVEETRRSNAATAERTRQETLETVLKALDLPGYGSNGTPFSVRIGIKPEYPTDRFWADINTALEVRAERKAAYERAATEAKIAGLNKRESENWQSAAFAKDVTQLIDSTSEVRSAVVDEKKAKKGGKK